jgi:hypothetical protein
METGTDYWTMTNYAEPSNADDDASGNDDLENLIGLKSRILQTKLQVLAAEIGQRWFLRQQNQTLIRDEEERVNQEQVRLSRQVNYQLREPRDLAAFQQQRFRLDQEQRDQETACWKDIVPVLRDFLEVWEAHEQAKARAMFLNHAGSGIT